MSNQEAMKSKCPNCTYKGIRKVELCSDCLELKRKINREYQRKFRATNPVYRRLYCANNKERIKEYQKRYYVKNREKIIAQTKQWRANNIEKCREHKRRYRAKNQNYAKTRKKLKGLLKAGIKCRFCGSYYVSWEPGEFIEGEKTPDFSIEGKYLKCHECNEMWIYY